jgi:hypothetical protein
VPVSHDRPDALPLQEAPAATRMNSTVKAYRVDSFRGSFKPSFALHEKHVISLINFRAKEFLNKTLL